MKAEEPGSERNDVGEPCQCRWFRQVVAEARSAGPSAPGAVGVIMLERLPVLDRNHVGGVRDVRDDINAEAAVESARVREDREQRARSVLEVVGSEAQVEEGGDSHAGDASTWQC